MRRVALICSLLLLSTAADAQPRLKRDDTPAPAPPAASAQPKTKAAKPKQDATKQPASVETRPRLKRDDTPAAVAATPAAPPAHKRKGRPQGAADQQGGAPPKGMKASVKDIAACGQTRDPDAAIAGCTSVIADPKQKPKARAGAYFNRGNAAVTKGDPDKGIADFDEAIKLDPKNASAYNNRGSAKNEKGDVEGAVADFDAALKQNGRYASAYFNRASAFAAKVETARAMKDFDAAIRFNRRNVNAYIARGALFLASGATARARADMQLAARLDRKNAYAVLWHDIAERRAKGKGVLPGGKGLKDVEMKGWPAPVLLMFVGELKPDGVLIAADDANAATKQAHTCEANFYSGEYALIGGKRDEAVKMFQAAAKDCPHGFLEGIAAAAELKGLGEKSAAN